MRKILMFGTMLGVATTALAFGGVFNHGSKSTTYKGGVNAIGVHFGGEGKADIKNTCPEHSEWSGTECVCEPGWQMVDTECAPNSKTQCDEQGMYWCVESQRCVADAAACLDLCPQSRKCGEGENQICCSEGQTCDDGQCCDADGNCCTEARIPYCTERYDFEWHSCDDEISCCAADKVLTRTNNGFPIYHKECCDENSVPYVDYYALDEVIEQHCCEKEKKLTTFGQVSACCDEDEVPYCLGNTEDNTCGGAGCCAPENVQNVDGWGVWCCEEGNAYCVSKDENGVCAWTDCCSGALYTEYNDQNGGTDLSCCELDKQVMPVEGENIAACCHEEEMAFCRERNADGTCRHSGCCSSGQVALFVENRGICCNEGEIAYCAYRNEDGSCDRLKCTLPGCAFLTYDRVTACCAEGENIFADAEIGSNDDMWWYGAACCSSSMSQSVEGVGACCYYGGQQAYCDFRNSEGICKSTECCYENKVRVIDNVGKCCTGGQLPYCNKYNDVGVCLQMDCCWATLSTVEGLDVCCGPGWTGYCSKRNEDGMCVKTGCFRAGSVMEGIGVSCIDDAYCSKRNASGVCLEAACQEHEQFKYCARKNKNRECSEYYTADCQENETGYCVAYITYPEGGQWCHTAGCCAGAVSRGTGPNGADQCLP